MKVAILVADGFEQVEMTEPRKALDDAGADTRIVSPAKGRVQGWNHFDKADRFEVDALGSRHAQAHGTETAAGLPHPRRPQKTRMN